MSAETKKLATIPFPSFEGICFPRSYPVQVIDEGYVFDLEEGILPPSRFQTMQ
ncbi:MAG: hypothetical protein ACLU9T_06995 [Blautia faecis]